MKYQHVRRAPQGRRSSTTRKSLNELSTRAERVFAGALDELGIKHVQNFTVRTAEATGGCYYVDFYLPKQKLFVELDGKPHVSEAAQWRDLLRTEAILRKYPNHALVRLWNSEVVADPKQAVCNLL